MHTRSGNGTNKHSDTVSVGCSFVWWTNTACGERPGESGLDRIRSDDEFTAATIRNQHADTDDRLVLCLSALL
jgi:hypothetical protein